jgi:hypothetical protein
MLLFGKVGLRNSACRRSCIKRGFRRLVCFLEHRGTYAVKLHQEYGLYQDSFPEILGSSREGTLISAIVCRSRGN